MDTPYYEQLQYIGDTRIQALISYAVAGDDRLARQAIAAFDDSRIPEGITRSRYPSSLPQYIPTFSLLCVDMLHDYWMYRPDRAWVHARTSRDDAMSLTGSPVTKIPTASARSCPGGALLTGFLQVRSPPTMPRGESCVTTLQYLGALIDAADLEKAPRRPGSGYSLRVPRRRTCVLASSQVLGASARPARR